MATPRRSISYGRLWWLAAFGFLLFFIHATYFQAAIAQAAATGFLEAFDKPVETPDMSLWSESRKKAYQEKDVGAESQPIGVLTIDRVHVRAPIYASMDNNTLDNGLGHIPGTGQLDGSGNIGLAGHRDGFFRGLKDIKIGDAIRLQTKRGTVEYQVSKTSVVSPNDVQVLVSGERPQLTLVTCYPFYFLGSAPNRFIVHAERL